MRGLPEEGIRISVNNMVKLLDKSLSANLFHRNNDTKWEYFSTKNKALSYTFYVSNSDTTLSSIVDYELFFLNDMVEITFDLFLSLCDIETQNFFLFNIDLLSLKDIDQPQ